MKSTQNDNFKEYLESLGFKIKVKDIDPSDPSFAELRSESLGGSDSSKILGVNPFPRGDAQSLLIDKVKKFHDDSIGEKPIVRMGADLEDFISSRFQKATGWNTFKPTDMWWQEETGMAMNFDDILPTFNSEIPFLPIEIKLVSEWGHRYYNFRRAINIDKKGSEINNRAFPEEVTLDWIEKNAHTLEGETTLQKYIIYKSEQYGIPAYYYTQLLDEMAFTNAPYGFLIAMSIKNWTLYGFKVKRDDYIIDNLFKLGGDLYKQYLILKEGKKTTEVVENPL